MNYRNTVQLPSPWPVSVAAHNEIWLGAAKRSQYVAGVQDRYRVRASIGDRGQVVVHHHQLEAFLPFQRVFDPHDLPVTGFSVISLGPRRADHDQSKSLSLYGRRRWEEVFEQQVASVSVIMVSTCVNFGTASESIHKFRCPLELSQ